MKTLLTLIVGLGSYALFLVASVYAVSFTLGGLLPDPISIPHATLVPALLIDVGFIFIFGFQHSTMARSRWKARWTAIVPPALERSFFVLITSCILLAAFWCWQPISATLWQIDSPLARAIVYGICLLGWGIVLWSTFQIDHFELFGLRQTWQAICNKPPVSAEFRRPFLYRFVRHPMMAGFLVVFWATPTMTIDRLVLALGMTVYILIGITFEERALRQQFGAAYEQYQSEVPRLIPFPQRLRSSSRQKLKYPNSGSVVKN